MSDPKITRLPTAATSYYTVRKSGRWWALYLVTPAPGHDLRTKLVSFSDQEDAKAYARETASRVHRPFKIGGKLA
jgi:hypothetical protein